MRYPRLRFFNRWDTLVASEALLLCFYMKRTHQEIAPAVLRALDVFRRQIHPERLDWFIDHDAQTYVLDDARWAAIREEMLGPEAVYCPRFAGTPETAGGLYVEYRGVRIPSPWPAREHDASGLYLRIPTEYLEEHGPGRIRELAVAVAEELPFNSGYVDLGLNGSGMEGEAAEFVRVRYPGIHMTGEGPDLHMDTHVDGVHWMNFLGQPVLGKLGGIAGLREHLSLPGITIHDLGNERAVITLGDAPNPGDTETGETLPLHRALARLLEPHLYRNTRPLGRMTPEDMRRWERRFLD